MSKTRPAAVLGIDQSLTACALTLYVPFMGHSDTVVIKPKTKGVQRLIEVKTKIFQQVCAWGKDFDIQHICMEGYAFGAKFQREQMGECGGAVKMALASCFGLSNKTGYPTIVAPPTLKKYICGKGTGVKKNQVLLAVYKKWDEEFTDDNMADSYGLARLAAAVSGLSATVLSYEQDVVKKLSPHTEFPQWTAPPHQSPKRQFRSIRSTRTASTSSESQVPPTQKSSPRPSPKRSSTATKSSSGRSVRVQSTKP